MNGDERDDYSETLSRWGIGLLALLAVGVLVAAWIVSGGP